jgi:predicted P-loop ATPase
MAGKSFLYGKRGIIKQESSIMSIKAYMVRHAGSSKIKGLLRHFGRTFEIHHPVLIYNEHVELIVNLQVDEENPQPLAVVDFLDGGEGEWTCCDRVKRLLGNHNS